MDVYSWICLVLLCLTSCVDCDQSQCVFKLDPCEYTLQLEARGPNQAQCQNLRLWDSPTKHKFKISKPHTKKSYQNDESADVEKDSYKGATKFEKRILKSIDQLSVRMLRGVRRIERQVSDMMESLKITQNKPDRKCPTGFMSIDNWPSCYKFSKFEMSWYEAKDYCAAFDSDLVSLGTTREHYIVTYFIKNDKDYNAALGWWTSGTFVTKTKQWMWTAQLFLKPFSFIKWAPGEPNEKEAQCMVVSADDDHLWKDDLCTMRYNFVCEADARGI